ncbi:MAG: hypothetical protein U0930_22445 [Pirellulales bacterium]
MNSRLTKLFVPSTIVLSVALSGCPGPSASKPSAGNGAMKSGAESEENVAGAEKVSPEVAVAKKRFEEVGGVVKLAGGAISEIVIADGSKVTEADVDLFAKQTELQKLQLVNCRMFNDELVAKLDKLQKLTSLSLTNSVINDTSVEFIIKSFPNLTELDLSSNTNMTAGALKIIAEQKNLKSLVLVQNRFNEISTMRLKNLPELKTLDLRGNMEAGNMTMGVVGGLSKLTSFKHRSTAVSDDGLAKLITAENLENLLIQDFIITGQSGQHLAALKKLKQLEIFRCQGFDSSGVLALKGMELDRLTLRDLPSVDDSAMEVLKELPKLKKLFLQELGSVSDEGLKNLAALKTLELLDIWAIPTISDATVDVIATLPNLRELSIRGTAITDASVDKILAMPKLQSLTIKDNSSISETAITKLSSKKWTKLDTGKKD